MMQIAVMLGGNLPGSREVMMEAVEKFKAAGVKEVRCSRIVSSAAEDCVPGTPDFLDMGFTGFWQDGAMELLKLCQRIEIEAGRPAVHSSRESRILDCDIIFFGDQVIDSAELTVPHPRARHRRFVLEPLSEIVPQMCFADGTTVLDALRELPAADC
jgi:2-amino-4-hydroxy-6-hydroxymethyldihydropteridine diphosphokinase